MTTVPPDRNVQDAAASRGRVTPTVDDLRNEIRQTVGRFERRESTAFTKESLAAICDAVGGDVTDGRLPPKPEMRATIAERVAALDGDRDADRPFRKAELRTIQDALAGD